MKESSLALLVLLFLSLAAYGQSIARSQQFTSINIPIALPERAAVHEDTLAARSIAAVKRLEKEVLIYRSLGEFEANGRIARVSFEAFTENLNRVTAEVEPLLAHLPSGKFKTEITNALASYRDGAFWWQKVNQPRVVNVSALSAKDFDRTPSDTAFLSTVPYTVAIHWRQAGRYLKRAERLMDGSARN
jgi:hypothetical protein